MPARGRRWDEYRERAGIVLRPWRDRDQPTGSSCTMRARQAACRSGHARRNAPIPGPSFSKRAVEVATSYTNSRQHPASAEQRSRSASGRR